MSISTIDKLSSIGTDGIGLMSVSSIEHISRSTECYYHRVVLMGIHLVIFYLQYDGLGYPMDCPITPNL